MDQKSEFPPVVLDERESSCNFSFRPLYPDLLWGPALSGLV